MPDRRSLSGYGFGLRRLTIACPKATWERLDAYCAERGFNVRHLVELLLWAKAEEVWKGEKGITPGSFEEQADALIHGRGQ